MHRIITCCSLFSSKWTIEKWIGFTMELLKILQFQPIQYITHSIVSSLEWKYFGGIEAKRIIHYHMEYNFIVFFCEHLFVCVHLKRIMQMWLKPKFKISDFISLIFLFSVIYRNNNIHSRPHLSMSKSKRLRVFCKSSLR